jgi:hypothetical protein
VRGQKIVGKQMRGEGEGGDRFRNISEANYRYALRIVASSGSLREAA